MENDLAIFNRTESSDEAPHEDDFPLINAGILGFGYNPINVEDQDDYKMSNRYSVLGGEAVVWVTSIGRKLKEILETGNII